MSPRAPLLPLLAALLAACGRAEPPAAPADPVVRTLVVAAAAAAAGPEYSGEVRARHEVPVSFRVGGKILERPADPGDRIRRGQLLARLDPGDLQLQAAQASAQLALARAEAARHRELRRQHFVSAAALEAREAALAAAESQAGLTANQAAYARLTADAPGVVTAVLAEPGQVVGAGQPVVRLALDGEREVAISIPESAVAAIAPGTPARVRLWSAGGSHPGRVREVAGAADPATRTFAARVAVTEGGADLVPGMSATVSFPGVAGAGTLVPLAALFQQGDRPAVFVVRDDQTLELRPVTVAAYTDGGARVGGGLAAGERIVAAGVHKLQAGRKVRIAP